MPALTTTQLTDGDLVASARAKLIDAFADADMLGSEIGQDGIGGQPVGPYSDGWVFPGFNDDNTALRNIKGTGLSSVTLVSRDSWAANQHNTQEFPVLTATIESDCFRDAMGNPAARDADMRVKRVAKVVRRVLADPANADHDWPLNVTVNTSVCTSQLSIRDVPESDGAVQCTLRFELSLA